MHQGTQGQGEAFFEKFWPLAPAIADPERVLFQAFSLHKGKLRDVVGLRSLMAGLRATFRGNGVGKPVGDVWQMPGAFVLHEGRVIWSHAFRHAGDLPAYEKLPEEIVSIVGGSAARSRDVA